MLRTVMVGSGNLHQPFFCFYFVRFFFVWRVILDRLRRLCLLDVMTLLIDGPSLAGDDDKCDQVLWWVYFSFRRRVALAMHKSAFQLLRRIVLILIFMADRTNFFLRFVVGRLHSLAFLTWSNCMVVVLHPRTCGFYAGIFFSSLALTQSGWTRDVRRPTWSSWASFPSSSDYLSLPFTTITQGNLQPIHTAFGAITTYEERSTKTQFFKCSPDG